MRGLLFVALGESFIMKKQNKAGRLLLAALTVALIAVVAYIILKQMEYGQSTEFYGSLRGML